jgi:hypothetical protein
MFTGAGNRWWPLAVVVTASIAVFAAAFLAVGQLSAVAALRGHDSEEATASAQSFEESLRMRMTKKDGTHIFARGRASGSIDGKVSFRIHTVNGSKATATLYGSNSRGTISGTGVARYRVNGAVTHYSGKIKTLSGTGQYSYARSLGITLSGTVNRRTFDVRMSLAGRWHA